MLKRALLFLGVLLLASCRTATPDLILGGGRVFTADDAKPRAEAVAIRGDRIIAVGSDAEVRALAGPSTRIIELAGRVVVPGINDAHVHEPWGIGGTSAKIADNATVDELLARVAAAAKEHPEGTLLTGTVPIGILDDPRLTRDALDAVAPRHPVRLGIISGHAALHNTAALRLMGIAEDVRDTQGGTYVRDANGRLTGWANEHALWIPDQRLGEALPDAEHARAIREFEQEAVSYGITSVQSMPTIATTRAARLAENDIPLRWRWMDLQLARVEDSPRTPMKYILDGTPMERGAAMRKPYADRPSSSGRMNYTDDELARIVRAAANTNAPLLLHISGDLPIEKLLALLAKTPADWPSKRVRIEHGDFAAPFAEELKRYGLIVVQNPSHFTFPQIMHARLGGAPPNYQAARSLVDNHVRFALGSDGPVNPWLNVMFAALHPRNPAEALTREQAVIAYTREAAFAEFAEHEKGTIAPGKLADLAVLSQDVFTVPLEELPKTTSMLTLIGGRVVWEAK